MREDNKKIEQFINNIMSEAGLEQPSLDFTANVLSQIEVTSTSNATVYKPLISKSVWILILGSFIALIGYVIIGNTETTASWIDRLELPKVSLNLFENVSSHLSSTLMYAFVLLALMVSIQVPLVKYYFKNRITF
ncbi:hypothetical protein [Winogradskyella endarachnes]|uniref:Uncharacterized protein n=1 Tax=Winogradskyella endarachnes TaxID=2681965 RepID=A0A6L6U690_9FLAO|nr:hypothetical protein [Winogradskyella endarachnes]MUU77721.1 hypothetical protein [Winogradskyella endarachnes]